jgi:trk system potassium uptake protein
LVPGADWMLADACELGTLQAAGIQTAHVVIAATGDDKANLVLAMLCKTEFAVRRVVARVNNPSNQWLFTDGWGVDVAVSTPSTVVTAVEEAVSSGDVVRLMTLQQGAATIVECTLPPASQLVDKPLTALRLPPDTALLAILRGKTVLTPATDLLLRAEDELVLLVAPHLAEQVRTHLR